MTLQEIEDQLDSLDAEAQCYHDALCEIENKQDELYKQRQEICPHEKVSHTRKVVWCQYCSKDICSFEAWVANGRKIP